MFRPGHTPREAPSPRREMVTQILSPSHYDGCGHGPAAGGEGFRDDNITGCSMIAPLRLTKENVSRLRS